MKKMKGRLLTALMSLAMAFTMMPIMGAPVYADDPAPAAPGIALGPDVLSVGSNTSGAATVHMAGTEWRVIGYGKSTHQYPQVASSTDTMTLIAADNLETDIKFNTDWQASDGNCYGNSNLKTEIDKLTGASGIFSDGEKECIQKRDLTGARVWIADKPDYYTDYIAGDPVEKALIWPLSTKEAYQMDENLRHASNDDWWLRSPGEMSQVAVVRSGGSLSSRGSGITNEYGVRPAFNYNLKSVIFTSAAEGGKSSGDVGAGSLKSVEPNSNNEWKLTLKSGHDNFKVENGSTCDGKTVIIEYSGAVAAKGEYISAIITDENDAAKYYGNLIEFADGDSDSGIAKVTIGGKMEPTDKLYVFNEQLNGDNKTDYASELIEITVPTATGHIYMWEYVNDANHMGTCTICGAETTEEHNYNQERCVVCNARCKHSSLNDSYSHDLYRHWITCAYCGNVIEYEEHTWQDEWTADETQHWYECSVCKRKKDTADHTWDAGTVTKAATKDVEGMKTYTCTVCNATKTETILKLKPSTPKISGTPTTKMSAGKTSITMAWSKIQGVDGYDIFFAQCNHNKKKIACKNVKTIKGNNIFTWKKSGLKKGTAYKAYVKAYVMKNGKKTYVKTSPMMHAYTGNGTKKYTNAKIVTVKKAKVSLKKGKTYKIKASVKKMKKNKRLMPKSHVATLRYLTSNSKVATVSKSGKITAKGKGSCVIYVFAHNGVSKQVKVTVN